MPREDTKRGEMGPSETVAIFEAGSTLETSRGRALFEYADALRQLGRCTDALKAYAALEDKGVPPKEQWRVTLFKGTTLSDMGRHAEAETAFRAAAELINDTIPVVHLASCLARQERFAEAINTLTEGLKRPGDTDEVFLHLALNQRALGLYEEAVKSVQSALQMSEDYAEAKAVLRDLQAAVSARS